jgi:hypothetical protein
MHLGNQRRRAQAASPRRNRRLIAALNQLTRRAVKATCGSGREGPPSRSQKSAATGSVPKPVVLAPSMEAYEAFTRETLLSDPNVRGFTTHVVLERVKAGVGLPIQR